MLEELIHCHSSVNYFVCMPLFLWKCHVSGHSLRLNFLPQSISNMGKIIQLNHSGNFFLFVLKTESFPAGFPTQRLEAPRCISAAVWDEGFKLCIKTGKQSAPHLSMLRCGNDFTVPHTYVVGNIGRIQWWRLAHIFSQFPCPCPQSGAEDPKLLSAP